MAWPSVLLLVADIRLHDRGGGRPPPPGGHQPARGGDRRAAEQVRVFHAVIERVCLSGRTQGCVWGVGEWFAFVAVEFFAVLGCHLADQLPAAARCQLTPRQVREENQDCSGLLQGGGDYAAVG